MFKKKNMSPAKTGLLLSGGGARAAYQVGVLKAISELCPDEDGHPFKIISGTSAGSINAIALASYKGSFSDSVQRMLGVWENFELNHVFKSDSKSLIYRMFRWLKARLLPFGLGGKAPTSILDNSPLRKLLSDNIDFSQISKQVLSGDIEAISINASSYSTGQSVSFYESHANIEPWQRAYRSGVEQRITLDMLMASSSIPLLFPPVEIDGHYYGDGSMRQNTPLSPLVHFKAKKIMIIGVRKRNKPTVIPKQTKPSLAQISGFILDTLFLNSLDSDIERLTRVNQLIKDNPKQNEKFQPIEHIIISPSKDIGTIAQEKFTTLPFGFRTALKILGIHKSGGKGLTSYLMFNKEFCNTLIDLGYQDAKDREEEIKSFLEIEC